MKSKKLKVSAQTLKKLSQVDLKDSAGGTHVRVVRASGRCH